MKKALADPTTARIAVGFSGDSVQPVTSPYWAWSGSVAASRIAKPRSIMEFLFIGFLFLRK
jgi:hypothetical protein